MITFTLAGIVAVLVVMGVWFVGGLTILVASHMHTKEWNK